MEQLHTVRLPTAFTELVPGANPDFYGRTLTVKTSSPVCPETAWHIDLDPPHAMEPAQPVNTAPSQGYDSRTGLVCTQMRAVAADGASVPITLAHKEGTPLDGSTPLLLTVYGAYGMCADAGFRPERISLMERG